MWKRFTENLNFHSFENRLNYLQITEHRMRIIIVNLCWSRENLNRAEQTSTYSTEIDSQQRSRAGWNFVHSLFCFVKRTIITTRIGFLISICCYCWWCCCCLPRIVFCFTSACTNTLRSWKKSIQSRKLLTLRHQPETRSRENILKTSSIWRFSLSFSTLCYIVCHPTVSSDLWVTRWVKKSKTHLYIRWGTLNSLQVWKRLLNSIFMHRIPT